MTTHEVEGRGKKISQQSAEQPQQRLEERIGEAVADRMRLRSFS